MTLTIYCKGSTTAVRCRVERWTFHDKYMGEQYVTFDVKSPTILQWEVGDYCIFRGQAYTLNYIPSCKQQARMHETGDAFVYEGIKFNSYADELTRCIMLDVVPTTGDYDQYKGTNYTGSAVFSLYCGETEWDGKVYAPVHTLADRIKANLDRLYPNAGWLVKVNDAACASDDAVLSFNNWTATQALAEVHNTFKCDYAIIGRTIYIGYSLPELTSIQDGPEGKESPESVFYFGYGKGYPTAGNGGGMGLFEIKKVSNSNQNIITRLRAYGSTQNLPYRYYMQRYSLPQTMYVHNLQLPDTFLPYNKASDPDGQYARHKDDGNTERDTIYGINGQTGLPNLRHVLGETNDAYVDKNDDAASCEEGIREGVGAWDGSQSDLEEIYPTIQGMTYGELRASAVPDVLNVTGSAAYKSNGAASPYYQDAERVDELLSIGEDCNIGDGIVPLGELENREVKRNVEKGINDYTWVYGTSPQEAAFAEAKKEFLLTTIDNVLYEGNYQLSPTHKNVILKGYFGYVGAPSTAGRGTTLSYSLSYKMRIVQVSQQSGAETEIASYVSPTVKVSMRNSNIAEVPIVAIPDAASVKDGETPQVSSIHVSEASDIKVYLQVIPTIIGTANDSNTGDKGLYFRYEITKSDSAKEANLIWSPVAGENIADSTFHIQLKELGFDLSEAQAIDDGSRQITMKTGNCVGRTFDIVEVKSYTDPTTRKRGWDVELARASDDTIHVYYPNVRNTLQPGDRFVLTNIELPDAYIKAAEVRLLRAATDYLADNCETKYTYEPALNDIYLQQNYEKCLAEGEKEKSIIWRLYAGLKLPFRGIPESEDELDPLPEASITISQVEIKVGEKLTPQVTLQLNDDLEQSTIQKLTTTVDRIYNAINGYAGAQSGGGLTSAFYELLKTEGAKRFLSRTSDDTAQGAITFKKETTHEQGATFGEDAANIDQYGNTNVNNLDVAGSASVGDSIEVSPNTDNGDIVAEFGDTADGMLNGRGTLITNDGRVQTSTLEVRGTMKVLDLVASQIHSLNGYYYFTDTMKTEAVTECQITELTYSYSDPDRGIIVTQTDTYVDVGLQPHAIPEGATLISTKTTDAYMLTFEKEHENDFLKFYQNDVLLSIMTDLSAANAERGVNETGNAMLKDVTSQSWMRVVLTTEDGDWTAMAGENTDGKPRAVVLLYPDAQVPGHVNSAPQAGYYVARRGNADTSTNATKSRQNSWCISVEEGRLDYYINQTRPVSGDENYAVSIGRLPDIKPVKDLGLEGEVGIYAKNLLVEHLYTVQWAGDVRYLTVDLGAWSAASAGNNLYYYKRETDGETSTVTYTNVQVSHNGYTWQSTATLTADGTEYIPDEPGLGSAGWVRIGAKHYYTTSETDNLDEGGVGMGAEEVVWFENQADLLSETNIVDGASVANSYYYCALRPYMWKKTVQSTSASTEAETVELIGVYGETGTNYFIQSSHEYVTLDQDESSKTIALTLSFFTDNGGVRNPFECYCRVRMRKKNGDYSTIFRRFYGTGASDEALTVTEEDAAIEVYCSSSGEDMFTTWLIRKEIPVLKGAKGDKGSDGAIVRVFQDTLVQGFTYYAGEEIAGSSVRYKDFIVVPTSKVESGYLCLECKAQFTHTQATIGSISEAFSDDVGAIRKYFTSAQTEYSDGRQCLGEGYWSETSLNAVSAFFTFLVARNAFIRMLSGSQFVITDGQGKVLAGMGNRVFRVDENGRYEGEEGFDEENVVTTAAYYIWAGGESAKDAKFCVYADGSVKMNNGTFGGWLYHPPKLITGKNIKDYVYIGYEYLLREDKQAYESTRVWMLDYEKTGPCFVLYDEGATQDEGHIQSALIDLDVEQNGLPQNEATDILYLRLPWFASYVQCDTTAAGAVYRYDNGHVGATLDHMRKAYAMANCDIHIFNSSYSELYINGGVCLSPDSWSVPSDAPTILYQLNGDNNYLGTEFFATAKFCFLHNDSALKKEDYVGTALRWVEQDLGVLRQSTLMSRDHAKLIAEEE